MGGWVGQFKKGEKMRIYQYEDEIMSVLDRNVKYICTESTFFQYVEVKDVIDDVKKILSKYGQSLTPSNIKSRLAHTMCKYRILNEVDSTQLKLYWTNKIKKID